MTTSTSLPGRNGTPLTTPAAVPAEAANEADSFAFAPPVPGGESLDQATATPNMPPPPALLLDQSASAPGPQPVFLLAERPVAEHTGENLAPEPRGAVPAVLGDPVAAALRPDVRTRISDLTADLAAEPGSRLLHLDDNVQALVEEAQGGQRAMVQRSMAFTLSGLADQRALLAKARSRLDFEEPLRAVPGSLAMSGGERVMAAFWIIVAVAAMGAELFQMGRVLADSGAFGLSSTFAAMAMAVAGIGASVALKFGAVGLLPRSWRPRFALACLITGLGGFFLWCWYYASAAGDAAVQNGIATGEGSLVQADAGSDVSALHTTGMFFSGMIVTSLLGFVLWTGLDKHFAKFRSYTRRKEYQDTLDDVFEHENEIARLEHEYAVLEGRSSFLDQQLAAALAEARCLYLKTRRQQRSSIPAILALPGLP